MPLKWVPPTEDDLIKVTYQDTGVWYEVVVCRTGRSDFPYSLKWGSSGEEEHYALMLGALLTHGWSPLQERLAEWFSQQPVGDVLGLERVRTLVKPKMHIFYSPVVQYTVDAGEVVTVAVTEEAARKEAQEILRLRANLVFKALVARVPDLWAAQLSYTLGDCTVVGQVKDGDA